MPFEKKLKTVWKSDRLRWFWEKRMENTGFDPVTSSLQTMRASDCANPPDQLNELTFFPLNS